MEQRLKTLELALIKPSYYTPRKSCTEEELLRLAKSIKQNGLLQPIVVREENEKYILISGAKRLSALKILGIKEITCIVQDQRGLNAALLCLIENMERSQINFFDEAEALKKIMQNFNLSEQRLSELLNISLHDIHTKLKLLNFDLLERELIIKNNISKKSANSLLMLNQNIRKQFIYYIIENNIPNRNIEKLCLHIINNNLKDSSQLETLQKKPPVIKKIAVNNPKLFSNSFFNMIENLRNDGLNARTATTETEEYIEYTVRIFKKAAL